MKILLSSLLYLFESSVRARINARDSAIGAFLPVPFSDQTSTLCTEQLLVQWGHKPEQKNTGSRWAALNGRENLELFTSWIGVW